MFETFPSPILCSCALVCVIGVALCLYRQYSISSHKLPFPPGPRPLPLLGNVYDMPTSREYETYTRWGKEFGDVVHVHALGKHVIILNSVKAANDLLERRSAIYSDRPYVPMLHEPNLMDSGWSFTFKPYSSTWKRHRRLFAQHLNPVASTVFLNRQVTTTHTLLRSLLHTPSRLRSHIKHAAANIILGIAYGYDVQPVNDPFVEIADRMVRQVSQGINPGGFLVNVFPWLNHVPSWCPGTGFKNFAAEARRSGQDLVELPFEKLKSQMEKGIASPSFVSNALTDLGEESQMELVQDIKEVAATMYGAGSDTTVSVLHSCILALTLNPDIQSRAHAELDLVLGPPTSPSFRLPTHDDRPNLPYIDAILKESLRWLPVASTGIPHATTEDDVYRGWRIPMGSIVVTNTWGILHDKNMYHDPFVFRPERFLEGEGKVPEPDPGMTGSFGFGRRVCPGRHLAEISLWIEIASLLAVFTFTPPKDKGGREIDIRYAATPSPGFLLHPQVFPCSIQTRSKEAEARIRETGLDAERWQSAHS